MTRDPLRDRAYFDKGIAFKQSVIDKERTAIFQAPSDGGRALRVDSMWMRAVTLVIQRYGRGDALRELRDSVVQLLDVLALKRLTLASAQLRDRTRQMYERLDLAAIYESLALLAFMVALRMPSAEILRAVELIGHPGEDAVLDHVAIACGDVSRECAALLKFPKVYDGLVAVILAPSEQRSARLEQFVTKWYRKMKPISWHGNHEAAEGAYFGYWCFEGALIAMLFGVDDAAVQNHPNYPGDLVRHFRATS